MKFKSWKQSWRKVQTPTPAMLGVGLLSALIGAGAVAQTTLKTVEVTGSAIKRTLDDQGSLPVSVYSMD